MSPSLLLEAVRDAARVAGSIALGHFRGPLAVERKPDGSEVTIADRDAERATRDWILRRFPGDAVLGEELGSRGEPGGRRWLIDPIDGTRTFVRGVPLWGSMVAVEEGGVVLAGAIFCPATGDMVAAALGEGCWHNDSPSRVSPVTDLTDATILATDHRFRHHPWREDRWRRLASEVTTARTWGDCYGYVLLATGRAEVMVDDQLSPWDVAAVIPIVHEAGGVLTDWRGQPGMGTDAVATNAALADIVRARLGVPE